jgi:hypothetical protein
MESGESVQNYKVPDLESYEQREEWRMGTYRSAWPIAEPPDSWKRSDEPTLKPGDLVGWVKHPDADLREGWYTPVWQSKHVGFVLMTRWVLPEMHHDEKEPELYPEALILWGDGDTTNTSHQCLEVLR